MKDYGGRVSCDNDEILQKDGCRNMIGKIELCPIGVVERACEQETEIRVFPEFYAGLKDIEDFSHLFILCRRRRFVVISAQKEV